MCLVYKHQREQELLTSYCVRRNLKQTDQTISELRTYLGRFKSIQHVGGAIPAQRKSTDTSSRLLYTWNLVWLSKFFSSLIGDGSAPMPNKAEKNN